MKPETYAALQAHCRGFRTLERAGQPTAEAEVQIDKIVQGLFKELDPIEGIYSFEGDDELMGSCDFVQITLESGLTLEVLL